ncbi:integrase core domain-containing protein [Thiohalocapsa marina]
MWLDDHGIEARYLVHDRDTKFTKQFDAFWKRAGVRCIRIPPKAPQANAFCESFIGTFKHQCLNHFVCLGLGQLAHINRVWLDYYHTQRPHQGAGNNVISADFRHTSSGPVKRQERLGGIVAWYEREAA